MTHDWRTPLWELMRAHTQDPNGRIVFTANYGGPTGHPMALTLLGKILRLTVTDSVLAELNALDEPAILSRLPESYRQTWTKAAQALRHNHGKSISLNQYATAVRVPTDHPKRKSTSANVYVESWVQVHSMKSLLPEFDHTRLVDQFPAGALKLEDLGHFLFPPGGYTESTSSTDETPAASTGQTSGNGSSQGNGEDESWTDHNNVIFFGPPGTGKSYRVDEILQGHLKLAEAQIHRTTFHPETSYYDFVGSFRPAIGWLTTHAAFVDADGKSSAKQPITYYRFEPGIFSLALAQAANNPKQPIALVIEEINRGNVAAIFGDIFQLLDRKRTGPHEGRSEYNICPNSEGCSSFDATALRPKYHAASRSSGTSPAANSDR